MLQIIVLELRLAICQLKSGDDIPSWVHRDGFWVIAHTPDELSIVCEEEWVPEEIKVEKSWRIMKIQGPLEFSLVGVLSAITVPLAQAGLSIFAISTFDTDYFLVKETSLLQALDALRKAGHIVKVA